MAESSADISHTPIRLTIGEPTAPARVADERFRALTSRLPGIVWIAAPDGTITFISDGWERYSGAPFREPGQSLHPDDRVAALDRWREALRTGTAFELEARIRRSDGEYRWFLARAQPIRDAGGRLEEWFGCLTDIHDLNLTREALRSSEERFRVATEAVTGFLYDWDPLADRVERFGGMEQVLGFAREEVPPTTAWWVSRVHPDDLPDVMKNGARIIDGDHAHYTFEYRFLHRDGHYVRISDHGRIVRDASGRAIRVVGGATNIDERRRLEQERERLFAEVQWERSRLRAVFDASPAFVAFTRGPDHVIEYVNEPYHRFTGRRDLIGRRLYDVFPEGRGQRFHDIRERVLRDGITFEGTDVPLAITGPDGVSREERVLDVTLLPITEPDGTRSGIILHGVDVTRHVQARREIERLLAESERAIRLEREARTAAEAAALQRDHVLDVVAHELGSPLTTIGIAARVLAQEDGLSAEGRTTIDLLERSVVWMHRMIRDLSDVASIEAGRVALDLSAEDPSTLVGVAAEMFAASAGLAGIALETRVAPGLPVVQADAGRVLQVLGNLLTNALRHTAKGGRVTLLADRDPVGVRFTVEDSGSGIPAEDLPHLFDRFWRKRRTAHRGGGLGLPIVRGIVEAHGGAVDVTSVAGEGSRFSFTIPAAR